ncbi:MAG: hypothetical protein WAV28_02815 [Sedimentisphaerales bacterium]
MKKFFLRHFPLNILSYTAEPHLRKSVKPVSKSQFFWALLEVLSSQNGHKNTNATSQKSNWSGKDD